MKQIFLMQIKSIFSNRSHVIYILSFSILLSVISSLRWSDVNTITIICIPIFCIIQLTPGLFVVEKENRTLESLMALPVTVKEIFVGKIFSCFILAAVLYLLSNTMTILISSVIFDKNIIGYFNVVVFLAFSIMPLVMFLNLSMKATLLSLKSSDSKACAMDITFIAFVYAIPCMIVMACVNQSHLVWIIIASIYIIIEVVQFLVILRAFSIYGNKSLFSNLLKS